MWQGLMSGFSESSIVTQTGMFSDWPFCRQASKFIPKWAHSNHFRRNGYTIICLPLKYTFKKMSWGMIFSALIYYYNVWIDHHEFFSCVFRNHWREKTIILNDWNDIKLLKIGERILTPLQNMKTLRRQKFKLCIIFLEIPLFHVTESIKVIYKLCG